MISDLLKKFFGDKSAKDRKEYQPIIDKANEFFLAFRNVSDNELRDKTSMFQTRVKEGTQKLEDELKQLTDQATDINTSIHLKEELFEEIDKLSKTIDDKIEEILAEILPEAFAVVKETARRWSENGQLTVTAKQFDRDLAAKKDGITIEGENAIWHNAWTRCNLTRISECSFRKRCACRNRERLPCQARLRMDGTFVSVPRTFS